MGGHSLAATAYYDSFYRILAAPCSNLGPGSDRTHPQLFGVLPDKAHPTLNAFNLITAGKTSSGLYNPCITSCSGSAGCTFFSPHDAVLGFCYSLHSTSAAGELMDALMIDAFYCGNRSSI